MNVRTSVVASDAPTATSAANAGAVQGSMAPATPSTGSTGHLASTTAGSQSSEVSARTKVWVNTESGIYHMPGTRWYGKTAHGKYVSEAEAIKEGDRKVDNGT